jgi:hypothetical protein
MYCYDCGYFGRTCAIWRAATCLVPCLMPCLDPRLIPIREDLLYNFKGGLRLPPGRFAHRAQDMPDGGTLRAGLLRRLVLAAANCRARRRPGRWSLDPPLDPPRRTGTADAGSPRRASAWAHPYGRRRRPLLRLRTRGSWVRIPHGSPIFVSPARRMHVAARDAAGGGAGPHSREGLSQPTPQVVE